MSYHSSAFPIEVATISLVMSFCFEPARGIPGNSTGADTVIPNPFSIFLFADRARPARMAFYKGRGISPKSQNRPAMMPSASSVTDSRMCSSGACCEQPG